jgi:AAA family ATP:ADP antiporter
MARFRVEEMLDRRLDLENGDRAILFLMGGQVACLLGAYTIAKVLRDSMFMSAYGASALPWGYLAVAAASALLLAFESRITRVLPGSRLQGLNQAIAIVVCAAIALLEPAQPAWLPAFFYVWTGSQALLLLSQFWIAALDTWDSQRARRIFPLLTGAGLVGGIAGGAFASWGVERYGATFLLWTLCALLGVVRGLTILLSLRLPVRPLAVQGAAGTSRFKLITASPYLRTLAAVLGIAVVVSTLVDFQFKFFAQQTHPNPDDLAAFLGRFYAGFHTLALIVQFGVAGWVLRRIGIGPSSALQPVSMLLFGAGLVVSPVWPLAQAMRWVQGIVFQTLGKSTTEIYFMAVRPPERRQVKPVLDVVVERAADALAGIALLLLFRAAGVDPRLIAGLIALAALVWLVLLFRLHGHYVRAFRVSLAAPWAEPDTALSALRVPGAVDALAEGIRDPVPRHASIALRFAARARHPKLAPAVRAALDHSSPRVRTEAVRAATAMGLTGEDERVRAFLDAEDAPLVRAALEYLLTLGKDGPAFARQVIDGDERLKEHALDLMVEKPALAHGAITLDWVDRRIAVGTPDALRDAARGLARLAGPEAAKRLRELLSHDEREVRRDALRALARRPEPEFFDIALAHLNDRGLRNEAQQAVITAGERAVAPLERIVRESDDDDLRALASAALGRIGSRRARRALFDLARSGDPVLRFHGLRNLNRVRVRTGRRQVSRRTARRMFLREVRDFRLHRDFAARIPESKDPAVELLRAATVELADRSLARACRALACYHWPTPLEGAYEGLRSGASREAFSRSLEYLGSLLPQRMFQVVRDILEGRPDPAEDGLAEAIEKARQSPDPWIRAIAARADQAQRGAAQAPPADEAERELMTEVEKVIYLRGIDLFLRAGSRQLLALAAFVREVPMWNGQVLYQETDSADALYVVVDGRVRLTAGEKVSEIGSGEAFGTWALVDDSARGQRADCLEDGLLLALAREDFYDFASGDAQLLKHLVSVLAGRLKELVVERPDEARVEGEGMAPATPAEEEESPDEPAKEAS